MNRTAHTSVPDRSRICPNSPQARPARPLSPPLGDLCRRSAFSLVELLVASAIMAVMLALILSIVASVMNQWNRQTEELALAREATFALDQLEKDLVGLIRPPNRETVLVIKTASATYAGEVFPGINLRLLSRPPAISSANELSGTAAIAYAVLPRHPLVPSDPAVPALYRAALSGPRVSQEIAGNLQDPGYDDWETFSQLSSASEWLQAHFLDGVVALNLFWQFKLSPAANPPTLVIDTRSTGSLSLPAVHQNQLLERPASVEISITLLTRQGREIMENRSAFPSLTTATILQRHSQEFTRRIVFD